jgi:hypothetical protein
MVIWLLGAFRDSRCIDVLQVANKMNGRFPTAPFMGSKKP